MIAELIAIGLGIALHQTKPLIEGLKTDSQTVKNLAHYGAGYIGAGLVFKLFIHDLSPHDQRIAKSGFWLAGVFLGLGVFFGYVLDSLRGK